MKSGPGGLEAKRSHKSGRGRHEVTQKQWDGHFENAVQALSKHHPSYIQASAFGIQAMSCACVTRLCFPQNRRVQTPPKYPLYNINKGNILEKCAQTRGRGGSSRERGRWPLEFYHGVFWCPWRRWPSRASRILPRRFLVPLAAVALKTFRTARLREWRCFGRCCATAFWQSCTTT